MRKTVVALGLSFGFALAAAPVFGAGAVGASVAFEGGTDWPNSGLQVADGGTDWLNSGIRLTDGGTDW
ncbi:hypothetical protein ACWFMI_06285 [Nocardiopsis terrae]